MSDAFYVWSRKGLVEEIRRLRSELSRVTRDRDDKWRELGEARQEARYARNAAKVSDGILAQQIAEGERLRDALEATRVKLYAAQDEIARLRGVAE